MANHEDTGFSEENLTLEPLEDQSTEAQRKGKAKFQVDTRNGGERRKADDRRGSIRFQDDRRSGKDRRAGGNGWGRGVDI